jgi:hypothetical protein
MEKRAMQQTEYQVGDVLKMKKNHPCGGNTFDLLRIGMDFKIRCQKCGHEVMVPRNKITKNIKSVIHKE